MLNADSQYYCPLPDVYSTPSSESVMGEYKPAVSRPVTDVLLSRQLVMECHPRDALQCADDAVLVRTPQRPTTIW